MNILAMSHSCVTSVNQKPFKALDEIPGVNVELIMPAKWRNDYTGQPMDAMVLEGIQFPIHQMPVAVKGHVSLHTYLRLPRASELKYRPDIVLSTQEPWSISGFQAALLARRLRVPFAFQHNQNIVKNYPPPFNWIEQYQFRAASVGMPCTDQCRDVLLQKGMKKPIEVIPFSVDLSSFEPGTAPELRSELGLEGVAVIGHLGRLVVDKGVDILIDAAKILSRQPDIPAFKVLIIGAGSEEQNLRERVKENGLEDRVVFAGVIPHAEVGRYYQCFDIFTLCSRTLANWKEQFGRTLIESMACSIPVVGSNSGSIPGIIEDTGGGLIFAENDPADCAAKLASLLRDEEMRVSIGKTGLQSVRARYELRAVAQRLADVLKMYAK